MSQQISLFVTVPTLSEAEAISLVLVQERLVACANLISNVQSIYHWKGSLERSNEVILICKTREELYAKAESRIKELHSYECPCIIAYPVSFGFPPYLAWIDAETTS